MRQSEKKQATKLCALAEQSPVGMLWHDDVVRALYPISPFSARTLSRLPYKRARPLAQLLGELSMGDIHWYLSVQEGRHFFAHLKSLIEEPLELVNNHHSIPTSEDGALWRNFIRTSQFATTLPLTGLAQFHSYGWHSAALQRMIRIGASIGDVAIGDALWGVHAKKTKGKRTIEITQTCRTFIRGMEGGVRLKSPLVLPPQNGHPELMPLIQAIGAEISKTTTSQSASLPPLGRIRIPSWKKDIDYLDLATDEVYLVDLAGWRQQQIQITGPTPVSQRLRQKALFHLLEEIVDANDETITILLENFIQSPWVSSLKRLEKILPVTEQHSSSELQNTEILWAFTPGYDSFDLRPFTRRPKLRGGFTKPKRASLESVINHPVATEQDRETAKALKESARSSRSHPGAAGAKTLIDHPKVFLSDDFSRPVDVRQAEIRIAVVDLEQGSRLVPFFGEHELNREEIPALRETALSTSALLLPEIRQCLVGLYYKRSIDLAAQLLNDPFIVPTEGEAELLSLVEGWQQQLPVVLPPRLAGTKTNAKSRPVLNLQPMPDGGLSVRIGVRPLDDSPLLEAGKGETEIRGLAGGERAHARRDLGTERQRQQALLAVLPLPDAAARSDSHWELQDPDPALDLVTALDTVDPSHELALEWPKNAKAMVVLSSSKADPLRVQVAAKKDWFGLEGGVQVDGDEVALAMLLDAARRGRRYVQVSGERWLRLSEQLRTSLQQLSDVTQVHRNRLEIAPNAAVVLDKLVEEGVEFKEAKAWSKVMQRLRDAKAVTPRLPKSLNVSLRPYQHEGYVWAARLAKWGTGGILADDMGLGKTVQALALLVARQRLGPALVVAPTSVTWGWEKEAHQFAPSLNPILYRGTERAGSLKGLGPKDVLVTSYGILLRDAEALNAVGFATAIFDEAQALKNAATRRARLARDLQAGFKLALTGTPVENHVGELWSLFAVVCPGLLGSQEAFRSRFATPIERDKSPMARAALARAIRPFLLRRTKRLVAPELPSRTEVTTLVEFSEAERKNYQSKRLALVGRLEQTKGPQKRFQVLAALTRLRLLACNARLDDEESTIESAKLKAILRLVDDLRQGGHRALLFSQFTKHLAIIRTALDDAGVSTLYLDGATPAGKRKQAVDSFQEGNTDVFLISLKAGGTGLNLTAANYVLHVDPWWNPAVEDQATDRAHRIGQDKAVTIYRLISKGTIEELICTLHAEKRELVDDLLTGTDSSGRLNSSELLDLVKSAGLPEEE